MPGVRHAFRWEARGSMLMLAASHLLLLALASAILEVKQELRGRFTSQMSIPFHVSEVVAFLWHVVKTKCVFRAQRKGRRGRRKTPLLLLSQVGTGLQNCFHCLFFFFVATLICCLQSIQMALTASFCL